MGFATSFLTLVDDRLERVSTHFGASAPSLHEDDYNDSMSFWYLVTITHFPFISIKLTPVNGTLGPPSVQMRSLPLPDA